MKNTFKQFFDAIKILLKMGICFLAIFCLEYYFKPAGYYISIFLILPILMFWVLKDVKNA